MAKLSVKYGAMNAGKSDILIKTAYNYKESGLVTVTTMPDFAAREQGYITSRPGAKWPIDIEVTKDMDLRDAVLSKMGEKGIDCVLADEAQFYSTEQIEQLEILAKHHDISVVAHCLRSNVQRKLFEGSKRLFELADNFEKMPTMCTCGSQAEYNGRFVNSTFHVGEPVIMIDNDESKVHYQPMCANCYLLHADTPGAITA
jgi:thymidine kinase